MQLLRDLEFTVSNSIVIASLPLLRTEDKIACSNISAVTKDLAYHLGYKKQDLCTDELRCKQDLMATNKPAKFITAKARYAAILTLLNKIDC